MSTEFAGYVVICVNCGKFMGNVDINELEYVNEYPDENLCFDCDPDSASLVPSLFWQWQSGDIFVLGDKEFMIAEHFGNGGEMFEVPHTRMSDSARSCLSSSTYLNTHPNQDHKWEKAIRTNAKCSDCETVNLVESELGLQCPECERIFALPEWVIIPAWIVNQPPVGKAYGDGKKGCPDCDTVRTLGGVGSCSYHSDLLDDNQREYLYGYGDA